MMKVVRVCFDRVVFWSYHFCSVVVGPAQYGKAASTVETFLEVSVVQEWQDETDRGIWG